MNEIKKFPIPSGEQEDIEEALGLIWNRFEKGIRSKSAVVEIMEKNVGPKVYPILLKREFVVEEGGDLKLTPKGEKLAKDIARRLRLSERLLSDVLNLAPGDIDPNACQWEHVISPEVSESICTLLGHPLQCPHGQAIPPGDCCQRREQRLESIVVPLTRMAAGDEGKIAYVLLQNHPELHKLMSLGVIPGTEVHLHQTFPAFILELGESQLALEESVAKNIYVRRR